MDSPYIEYTNQPNKPLYIGGEVSLLGTDSYRNAARNIIIVLLIIVVLCILYNIFLKVQINGEDYYQRQAHEHFNNLHGEEFDADAQQAIYYGEAIHNPRPIDHYRLGTAYLLNGRDPHQAHRHFRNALNQVIEGAIDIREAPFILDRIMDYQDRFVDFTDIEELPIQEAMLAHYNTHRELINTITAQPEIDPDDPEFKQKVLLSRQNWQSDSQNVHDSAVQSEILDQFKLVQSQNAKLGLSKHNYADAKKWITAYYKHDSNKLARVNSVFTVIDENYPLGVDPTHREIELIEAVWQRAHDPKNAERAQDIRAAIADAVADCYEGNAVVCMAGRSPKIWQALAKLDYNSKIGIIKTKQALRNEIFEQCAKIIKKHTDELPESTRDAYNHGEDTEQIRDLIETIKKEIDELKPKYTGRLTPEILELTIEECKATV